MSDAVMGAAMPAARPVSRAAVTYNMDVVRKFTIAAMFWAVVAFLGVVFLGTLKGILVAVILSLLALVQQEVNPPVYAIGRKRGTDVFRPLSARHPQASGRPPTPTPPPSPPLQPHPPYPHAIAAPADHQIARSSVPRTTPRDPHGHGHHRPAKNQHLWVRQIYVNTRLATAHPDRRS